MTIRTNVDHVSSGINDINPTGNIEFARRDDANSARYFGGQIGEIAAWHRDGFDAADIKSLSGGVSPLLFRDGLQYHLPWVRSREESLGVLTISNNQGTAANDHPRILRPR